MARAPPAGRAPAQPARIGLAELLACWATRGPGLYSRRGSGTPARSRGAGGVAERLKAPVLKTGMGASPRGFESLPLRHSARHEPGGSLC